MCRIQKLVYFVRRRALPIVGPTSCWDDKDSICDDFHKEFICFVEKTYCIRWKRPVHDSN